MSEAAAASPDLAAHDVAENKKLGPVLATVLVAGNMIGSGVYLLPATLAAVGSISIIGWVICTIGAMLLAGVFASLANVRPTNNGLVAYAEEALGPYFGFQAGVIYWLSILIGVIAIAVAFTGYLSRFFPGLGAPFAAAACTVAVIWALTVINIIGPKLMGRVGMLTLVVGLLPVFAVAFLGWFAFDPQVFTESWNVSGKPAGVAVQAMLVSIFWSFTGVESATVAAAVVRNPKRNVAIAAVGGVALSALVYILATAAISGILPAEELARSSAPFAAVAAKALGAVAAALVTVCALFKTAGTLGGWVLCTAETARSSAALGFFPHPLARVSKNGAPIVALVVLAVIMTGITFLTVDKTINERFTILINMSVLMSLVAYIYACVALIVFASGRYIHLMRYCGLLALAFCVWIAAMSNPYELGMSVALTAATLPLWWVLWWRRRGRAAA
jgi:arginine:agmatine antiporter